MKTPNSPFSSLDISKIALCDFEWLITHPLHNAQFLGKFVINIFKNAL